LTDTLIYKIGKEPALVAKSWACPSCESIVSYGNQGNWKGFEDEVNKPFVSLHRSYVILQPLLSMLPTGKYVFSVADALPINREDEFFWALKRSRFFYGNYNCDRIAPTQSPKLLNMDKVDFYRGNTTARAICFQSFLQNLVIDGHHKATAAALDGRKVPIILITPFRPYFYASDEKSVSVLRKAQNIITQSTSFHRLTAKHPYVSKKREAELAIPLRIAEEALFGRELLDSAHKYNFKYLT
ncbi:MAG: hypothetical protein LBV04_08350, partial [Deferribacteraceae bacterium]|jgi:hypothetical protein|nr:hypothetical protein [Deferribacteraceae bacterium]